MGILLGYVMPFNGSVKQGGEISYVYFTRQVIGKGKAKARQGTLDALEYPSQKRGGDWMNFTPTYIL